ASTALDDSIRLREEDPFTDLLTAIGAASVVVHRSRFEVDLNRPRNEAVYRNPEDAWGLDLWVQPVSDPEIERSCMLYDDFYRELGRRLDDVAARGPLVLLDLHSYNHRRDGADAPSAQPAANPEINVGTGSLDRDRWGGVVDAFIEALPEHDVRENVRFRGGELTRWVNARYPDRGCALAIEFKKTFMDEWTGTLDDDHLAELRRDLSAMLPALTTTPSGTS
ncbi:MAG TPA: N-formylglutamate amidohydrolase, partial [Acidimicrobiia bacterium]|nr:N-formylglutamate amidohydrolase [Acidimicrobiia bacterium]